MIFLYLLPAISGFILLALHFFRSDNLLAALLSFLMLSLMCVRRPWAARTLQVCLLIGAAEWTRIAISLIITRNEMGEPFLRLAIILGAVSLFTALSSRGFRTDKIMAHFKKE